MQSLTLTETINRDHQNGYDIELYRSPMYRSPVNRTVHREPSFDIIGRIQEFVSREQVNIFSKKGAWISDDLDTPNFELFVHVLRYNFDWSDKQLAVGDMQPFLLQEYEDYKTSFMAGHISQQVLKHKVLSGLYGSDEDASFSLTFMK
jgi:hypothetical protein